MPRCDGCKFWDASEGKHYAGDIGLCTRAHAFWDRTKWSDDYDHRILLPEAAGDMMFCQDGSDYHAILLTKPQFFCAHHEPK